MFMRTRILSVGTAMIAWLGLFNAVSAAESSSPEELRAEAAKLIAKAQDLKAEGSGEEATRLVKKAESLQEEAAQAEKQPRAKRGGEGEPRRDAKREINELRARFQELEAAGKTEEAAEVKRRLSELQERIAPERKRQLLAQREERREGAREPEPSPRQPRRPEPGVRRPEPRGDGRAPQIEGWRLPMDERERRLQHLSVAIENLRAAGMHEIAGRLEGEAERIRQEFRPEGRPVPPRGPDQPRDFARRDGPIPPGRMGPDGRRVAPEASEPRHPGVPGGIAELQDEISQLRQAVQELRRHLEELSRERR
jgi:chemotaxis protein histidine kinase CheA